MPESSTEELLARWERQLRKGLLHLLVLSVLNQGETYGYKLIASLSKQNPFAMRYLEPMVRAMGADGLARNLRAALECDRRLKGSPLKPNIIIEKLIFDLCEDRAE